MTASKIIIPQDSSLYASLRQMIARRRMVFLAGLPGVGKSLLLQQLALLAHQAGRLVHLLQWDVSRLAFETNDILARYPEVDGVTHAAIRKAVGLWARAEVGQWHARYPDSTHMLIGEVPLIGNRFIELAQRHADSVEALLCSEQVLFVIPVPSRKVRRVIESMRERTIAQPRHKREIGDASPSILQALWQDVGRLARQLGLTAQAVDGPIPYDPEVYAGVYQHLLQHRHTETLSIDTILPTPGSVYDLDVATSELVASPAEVLQFMQTSVHLWITWG